MKRIGDVLILIIKGTVLVIAALLTFGGGVCSVMVLPHVDSPANLLFFVFVGGLTAVFGLLTWAVWKNLSRKPVRPEEAIQPEPTSAGEGEEP